MQRLTEDDYKQSIDSARARYEEKRARRIARLEARAEKLRREGEARVHRAHEMASIIPLGQPILVGHHSEGRDRRYRDKIQKNFEKGYAAIQAADRLESRAESAESNRAIFSDDPDAPEKLREKLEKLKADREKFKRINRAVRSKNPREALRSEFGFKEETIEALLKPDFAGRVGIPSYKFSNASAEIRRLEARIGAIARADESDGKAETVGDVRIEQADNRVRLYFPDKPSADFRQELKRAGFRWSPTEGAWQRHASPAAWYEAKRLAERAS